MTSPQIYIPLWFYSNLTGIMDKQDNVHLHSTMVLFKSIILHHQSICLINLHSTMVLFKSLIFHFDHKPNKNLHSTMVLFKLRKEITTSNSLQIYIPLWFYSNNSLMNKCKFLVFIYIPLWFYSNPLPLQPNNSLIKTAAFVNP